MIHAGASNRVTFSRSQPFWQTACVQATYVRKQGTRRPAPLHAGCCMIQDVASGRGPFLPVVHSRVACKAMRDEAGQRAPRAASPEEHKNSLRQLIASAAAQRQVPPEDLLLIDEEDYDVLVHSKLITRAALTSTTFDNLIAMEFSAGAAGLIKALFPAGPSDETQASLEQELRRVAEVLDALQDKALQGGPHFSSLSPSVFGKLIKQAAVRVEPEFMVAMTTRQVPEGISTAVQALSEATKESEVQEALMTVLQAACQAHKTIPEMCVVDTTKPDTALPLTGVKDYIGEDSRSHIVLSLTEQACGWLHHDAYRAQSMTAGLSPAASPGLNPAGLSPVASPGIRVHLLRALTALESFPALALKCICSASSGGVWSKAHFPTMLGCLEVKLDLTKADKHDEAIGLLRARLEQTRMLVPDRKKFLGCVLDKQDIQLWLFEADRSYCTDRVPIHWHNEEDRGWQMLVGILAANYDRFGYVAPTPLPAFVDGEGERVHDCVPMRAHPSRPVYLAQRQGEPVIVKLGNVDSIYGEVFALEFIGDHPHLPTPCAYGRLPSALLEDVTHYLVLSPVGKLPKLEGGRTVNPGAAKQRKELFLGWLWDVVSALEHMHNQGWLHRDPSPFNMVIVPGAGAILLDFHLAVNIDSNQASYRCGTAAFWALSLHSNRKPKHTESTDLEAVFYTFLYIASNGHALSWRHQEPDAMKYTKLSVIMDDEEWQEAVSHCMEELRPTMSALRELFFPDASLSAYKRRQVTVAQFKEIIKA